LKVVASELSQTLGKSRDRFDLYDNDAIAAASEHNVWMFPGQENFPEPFATRSNQGILPSVSDVIWRDTN
jgi:hypothetical protein